ncbi:hypothetical protein HPB50_028426 [Hyalomma asiaticum]|nr:hypothetical protein HPB50_028426 [Hyalomma asiaticum]
MPPWNDGTRLPGAECLRAAAMVVRGSAMLYRFRPNDCLGHCDATNFGRPATFAVEPVVEYRRMQRARGVNHASDVPRSGSSCTAASLQQEAAFRQCAYTLPPLSPVPHSLPNQLRVRIEVHDLPSRRYLSYCALPGTFRPPALSLSRVICPQSEAYLTPPQSLSQALRPADEGLTAGSAGSVVDEHLPADSIPATTGVVANPHPPPNWNLPARVSVARREPPQPLLRAVDNRQQVEGMRVVDALEYVHTCDCIHADVKASMLFFGFGKDNENKVYLVDFAVPCRYTQNGKHKEDLRKPHDGTIELMSRDAHIGAHSRRGDMEILGYNPLQWLCCRLLWEDNLKDTEYLSPQKGSLTEDIPLLMSEFLAHGDIACGITEFLQYVASMKFENIRDYKRLKRILEKGIQAVGKL